MDCVIIIYLWFLLPFSTSPTCGHVGPKGWGLCKTIWGDGCCLISVLLLHSSPCYTTSHPGGYILVDLDHDEKYDAVYHNHAEDDTKIYPFWSPHINLEHILQNILPRNLGKIRCLVIEYQPLQIILVLSLSSNPFHLNSNYRLKRKWKK